MPIVLTKEVSLQARVFEDRMINRCFYVANELMNIDYERASFRRILGSLREKGRKMIDEDFCFLGLESKLARV